MPPPPRFRRLSDVILLVLFCVGLIAWRLHEAGLLASPVREYSDFASNAIKIDAAKHFSLLTGNYSRWDFCHPGPIFFYCYAGAEAFLHDFLHCLPSPGNAHMIAGLLIQVLFFAGALLAFARRIGNGWFLPLALLAAGIHYGLAFGNAWENIWPPNVLVFPFLALLVFSALLAAGEVTAFPGVVLAGGFLVHGHVAQPFFVVPIAGAGLLLGLLGRDREAKPVLAQRSVQAGLLLLALFLVPLVLEVFRPHFGNYGKIAEHIGRSKKWHTVPEAVLYGLSFLGYRGDQDAWLSPLSRAGDFLKLILPYAAAWIGLLALGAFGWWRIVSVPPRNASSTAAFHAPFLRSFGLLLILALALFAFWCVKQDGPLFAFNSFFFYSILYALVLLAVITPLSIFLTRLEGNAALGAKGAALLGLAATATVLILTLNRPPGPATPPDEVALYASIEETVARADAEDRPLHLLWPHDGWPTGVALALALDRQGIPWTVNENYHTLCNEHVLADPENYVKSGGAVWTLWPDVKAPTGYRIETAPGMLIPDGTSHTVSDQTNAVYFLDGFDADLDLGLLWTEKKRVLFTFVPKPAAGDVDLVFDAMPLTGAKGNFTVTRQRATLTFDGTSVGEQELREKGTARFRIPKDLWNNAGKDGTRCVVVRIDFPDAVAPKVLGLSRHAKPRAWGLISFGAETVKP